MNVGVLQVMLATVGLVSLASLGAILLFISPHSGGALAVVLLLVSIFFILASSSALLGIRARKRFVTEENKEHIYSMALREGVLFALAAVALLVLSRFGHASVWVAGLVVIAAVLIELFFLLRSRRAES